MSEPLEEFLKSMVYGAISHVNTSIRLIQTIIYLQHPNLLDCQYTVTQPNKVCTTDITYIQSKEGWLYLCVMLDLFSRRIVGWQTSHRIDRQLVYDAFNYTIARQGYPTGIMVHSFAKKIQNRVNSATFTNIKSIT